MTPTSPNTTLTKARLFSSPDAHPLALNLAMLREFGPSYLGWEPETCWAEIRLTWGDTISDMNKQKLQAVRSIYVNSDAATEWETFAYIAVGLAGAWPRLEISQRPSPARACMALDILKHVRDEKEIGDEIYKYCAAVLMDFGMVYGPGSLEGANKYLIGADPALQEAVRNLVRNNAAVPTPTATNATLVVQTMKSFSVRDFARSVEQTLAKQVEQLGL